MAGADAVKDAAFKFFTTVHRTVLDRSNGKLLGSAFGMPVVQLSTTGRRTGQRRTAVLTAPLIDDERVVLVASKGGDDRHPAWFLNLQADPQVEVTVKGRVRQMTARVASPEEKEQLWPEIVAAYKGYAGYQKRTSRDIPVVICENRG